MFEGQAIRRIQAATALIDLSISDDPVTKSLQYLSHLFSLFDKDVLSCWNEHCDPPTCTALTRQAILEVLQRLDGMATDVFGAPLSLEGLTEPQLADLLITCKWLKSRVWRMASLHGLTTEHGSAQLASTYVFDLASQTVETCQQLSFEAMECHGTGFVRPADVPYDMTLTQRRWRSCSISPSSLFQSSLPSVKFHPRRNP